MFKPEHDDERRSSRAKVILAGTLKHGSKHVGVRILDLSSHGALVSGSGISAAETDVTLTCGRQVVAGWVAWVRGEEAGINFGERVDPRNFVPKQESTSHLVVKDSRKCDFRRPGLRENRLSAEERAFIDQHASA